MNIDLFLKIDMGFRGSLGNDVTIKNGVLYLKGSNRWLEWVHHFLPGARWRERRWARQVVQLYHYTDAMIHTIAGHSVGGTVAIIAVFYLRNQGRYVSLYTCGAKRPPKKYHTPGRHYAIKGDPVPHLPPWRKALPLIVLDYGKLSWTEAHGPAIYYEQMRADGVR
jgi:hypothetical protein